MVGHKYGEFSWTRKLALYKAKQLKKKKKEIAPPDEFWTSITNILN